MAHESKKIISDKPPSSSEGWKRKNISQTQVRGIVDLAWLQTHLRQIDPITCLPVFVSVSCGRPTLQISDVRFELATWQVMIRLDLKNARYRFGSHRTIPVLEGSVKSEFTSKTVLMTVSEQQTALGVHANLKVALTKPSLAGALLAKFRIKTNDKKVDTDTNTTKTVPDIILIGQFGDGISIGDPDYGDPLRPNGLLTYDYPRDRGDKAPPLFDLEPIDPKSPME